MGHPATSERPSVAEYLEWERTQSGKHEYHLGEVFAMAGSGDVELEAGRSDVLANPRVIVEVLSRSTAAFDRGEKWDAYGRPARPRRTTPSGT